jgi:hypothetical protein
LGKFGKNYSDTGEFKKRLGMYVANDKFIEKNNYNADNTDEHDPVHCAHNEFSDWTQDEYDAILGFKGWNNNTDEGVEEDTSTDDADPGMLGIALATTVDHTPLMTDVKS